MYDSSVRKDFSFTQTFPQYFTVLSLWGFQELKSGEKIKANLYFNKA